MKNKLTPAERLIVAADFKGAKERAEIRHRVLSLADQLAGTGVVLKVNSALRACGYDLIDEIHARDLKVFADLKLNDIPATLESDGAFLREANPYMVTAMCSTGTKGLKALKGELPATEVLGVTVFTSFENEDAEGVYGYAVEEATRRLAQQTITSGIDGFISSPAELEVLREDFGVYRTFNTPGVRFSDGVVVGDDQNQSRVNTPGGAIRAGATRIVMGRPITASDSPKASVMRAIDEITQALE